jgi:hypothetical protein
MKFLSKFSFVLLILLQAISFQAYGFGSKRQVENVYVHDTCSVFIKIKTDYENSHWIESILVTNLNSKGWKSIRFATGKESVPKESVLLEIETSSIWTHGNQNCGIYARHRTSVFRSAGWDVIAVDQRAYRDSPTWHRKCVNGEEQSALVEYTLENIPSCQTTQEAEYLKTMNAGEKLGFEPGESYKE